VMAVNCRTDWDMDTDPCFCEYLCRRAE